MREPEGYRQQLEFLVDLFPGKAMVDINDVCRVTGRNRQTLLAEKSFPAKMVGKKYTISLTELAKWMVRR